MDDINQLLTEFAKGNFDARSHDIEAYQGNFGEILKKLEATENNLSQTIKNVQESSNQVPQELTSWHRVRRDWQRELPIRQRQYSADIFGCRGCYTYRRKYEVYRQCT